MLIFLFEIYFFRFERSIDNKEQGTENKGRLTTVRCLREKGENALWFAGAGFCRDFPFASRPRVAVFRFAGDA
jgi:hypothetical protein